MCDFTLLAQMYARKSWLMSCVEKAGDALLIL